MKNPYLYKAARAGANMGRNSTRRRASNRRRMRYWYDQSFKYSLKALRLTRQQRERAGLPKSYTVALP